ncbi:DUF6197 family protein [Streptomyces europaeiscabiei]
MQRAALQVAADLLEQTGWGPRSRGWPRDRRGPLRVTQALAEVVGHDSGGTTGGIPESASWGAMAAVLKQLGLESLPAFWDWEEEAGREQHDVVALLRSVADQFSVQPSPAHPTASGASLEHDPSNAQAPS